MSRIGESTSVVAMLAQAWTGNGNHGLATMAARTDASTIFRPTFSHRSMSWLVWFLAGAALCSSFSGARVLAGAEVVTKRVIEPSADGQSRLLDDSWRPWGRGFQEHNGIFECTNGADSSAQRGVSQTVELNQTNPDPIIASAWSRSVDVTGSPDGNYSLYLDLIYQDGTHLWGQNAPFDTDTHSWQQRRVVILPEKPVQRVTFYMLFRQHGGTAWFRQPKLEIRRTPEGAAVFDGIAVAAERPVEEGFQVRDVAAGSDFVQLKSGVFGLQMNCTTQQRNGTTFFDVTLADTRQIDRALTVVYTIPVPAVGLRWFDGPRRSRVVDTRQEYTNTSRFRVGVNGRLSRYPLGAVANNQHGTALAIDMARPAFYRVGYSGGTQELYLAYDIALTPEKPEARIRFCRYSFQPEWGFRAALDHFYRQFPEQFQCRVPEQGLWMPFAKISEVERWQDFGFKFKEGNNQTAWDDTHGITTFRYTEPMTWWMKLPAATARTRTAALERARELAEGQGDPQAKALLSSGYHDPKGQFAARILDTPWCDGAVWSMNSMPDLSAQPNHFSLKWNDAIRQRLYGPNRKADLDGEYIDSSEGYVTDELDFCRAHFAAADTPLCFSPDRYQPAIFRGLIAFEYVRRIADDVHAMDKLMMANSTPSRLCWLAPLLDVLGTETDWHPGGMWQPMSDADLLYRRALCRTKPFCFLMNTRFEDFSHALVEKYMKRALAYGMFPGFFSHNAAQGHYFTRPELYERDRELFKKYVPLCRQVAESGWQPITGARSSDEQFLLERFGDRYLTILNVSSERRSTSIRFDRSWLGDEPVHSGRELVGNQSLSWDNDVLSLVLDGEDVAVIDLRPLDEPAQE